METKSNSQNSLNNTNSKAVQTIETKTAIFNLKEFAISNIEKAREETPDNEDIDFFIGRMAFMASGQNEDCIIPVEVLKRDAKTVAGKFVTYQTDVFNTDFKSHENNLRIMGYIPPNTQVTFENLPDGRIMALCDCVLSKIYCNNAYQLFQEDNYRAVSAEFSCEIEEDDDGNQTLLSMDIHSITVLGKKVLPVIDGANIYIKKFSKDAEDFYNSISNSKDNFQISNGKDLTMANKIVEPVNDDNAQKQLASDANAKTGKENAGEKTATKDDANAKTSGDSEGEKKKTEDSNTKTNDTKEEDKQNSSCTMSDDTTSTAKVNSLDAYADNAALLKLLENETEDNKNWALGLAKKFDETKDANVIMSAALDYKKKADQFAVEQAQAEAKQCSVEFTKCMSAVKNDLNKDDYANLYAEGEKIQKMNDFKVFSQKVKAFAYDNAKSTKTTQNSDAPIVMGNANFPNTGVEDSDVFNRLAKKFN